MSSTSDVPLMEFRPCGRSGLRLPAISLGLWHNFGSVDSFENARAIARRAFDLGITHFDLANNYGPEPGSAEENFGRILRLDFARRRDELVISTKAGYRMWPGPYGDGGSRKYLVTSLDQSLRRMDLDYVDVFYHHRADPSTPLEETMGALAHVVAQGKALYVGLSNYDAQRTRQAIALLREMRVPCVLHQPRYSMLMRDPEAALFGVLREEGVGCIAFSPLGQGLLTSRYLRDVPADSRAAKEHGFLQPEAITDQWRATLRRLDAVARSRGQTIAQLAVSWVLRQDVMTSALIGASRPEQVDENVGSLRAPALTSEELRAIDEALDAALPSGSGRS